MEEASSLDRINTTKNQLEFDRKNFTPMKLTLEHERKKHLVFYKF